jgi:hypothetical protein
VATFYVNSAWGGPFNGTLAEPFATVASGTLGANDWLIAAGSVVAMGATQLSGGNNYTIRKYGTGANPQFTFSGDGLTSATATGVAVIEDVDFIRTGARGGTGANFTLMDDVGQSVTLRRVTLSNWTACVQGDRCRTLIAEDCTFSGDNGTYGMRARAHLTINCDNWRIERCTFACGIDLEFFYSNADCSLGAWNNLVLRDNISNGPAGCGTALLLRGSSSLNATDYAATASITGAGSGGGTLVRDAGSPIWPAWQVGTVLFLAGWGDVANFGTVTVTGGGGTRSVTVTNLGATLVNEGNGIGKGCAVIDPARAFNNPAITGNVIRNRGETPMFMDGFRGGITYGNQFLDTVNIGTVAAAMEAFGCYRHVAAGNTVDGITGTVTVDGMGLFWDGACQECVGIDNTFRNIRPTTGASNAGAAMASFFSLNCLHLNSTAENCTLGFWAGGVATRGTVGNCDLGGCDIGVSINSAPAAGAITVRSNDIQRNGQGIRDSSSAYVLGNSWSQNVIDNAFGTLASKDPGAVPAGQEFRLLPTPIRQVGAHPRAALEYVD